MSRRGGLGSVSKDDAVLRQYSLTVTGTNWTTTRAVGLPYQTQDGLWRLKFNIWGTTSSPASSITDLAVTGVTFKTGIYQVCAGKAVGTVPYTAMAQAKPATSVIEIYGSSSTTWGAAGDVELDSKPTFI
jgi:hypothetical protein